MAMMAVLEEEEEKFYMLTRLAGQQGPDRSICHSNLSAVSQLTQGGVCKRAMSVAGVVHTSSVKYTYCSTCRAARCLHKTDEFQLDCRDKP